jgi:hypothetical protein
MAHESGASGSPATGARGFTYLGSTRCTSFLWGRYLATPEIEPQQTTKQVQMSKIRPHGIAYALADGGALSIDLSNISLSWLIKRPIYGQRGYVE